MTFTRIDGSPMTLAEALLAHGGIEEKFAFASAVIVDPALREQSPRELVAEAMEYLADDNHRIAERQSKARGFRAAAATADRLFSAAWDPNAHPRDENGRFIDTPDVELSNGAHGRAIRQVGDAMVVELDSGTRVNVDAADVREGKPSGVAKPAADRVATPAGAPKKPATAQAPRRDATRAGDARDALNNAKVNLGRAGRAEVAAAERRLDRLEKYGPSGGGTEESELAAIAASLRGGDGPTAALSGASSLRLKADRGEEMYGDRATTRQQRDIDAMRRDADRLDKLAADVEELAKPGHGLGKNGLAVREDAPAPRVEAGTGKPSTATRVAAADLKPGMAVRREGSGGDFETVESVVPGGSGPRITFTSGRVTIGRGDAMFESRPLSRFEQDRNPAAPDAEGAGDRRIQSLRKRGWQATPGDDGTFTVTHPDGFSATYNPKTGRFERETETVDSTEIREGDFLTDVNEGMVRVTGKPTYNQGSGHLDIPVEGGGGTRGGVRQTGFQGRVERLVPDARRTQPEELHPYIPDGWETANASTLQVGDTIRVAGKDEAITKVDTRRNGKVRVHTASVPEGADFNAESRVQTRRGDGAADPRDDELTSVRIGNPSGKPPHPGYKIPPDPRKLPDSAPVNSENDPTPVLSADSVQMIPGGGVGSEARGGDTVGFGESHTALVRDGGTSDRDVRLDRLDENGVWVEQPESGRVAMMERVRAGREGERFRTRSAQVSVEEADRRVRTHLWGEDYADSPKGKPDVTRDDGDLSDEEEGAVAAAEMLRDSENRKAVIAALVNEADDPDLEDQLNTALDNLAEATRNGDEASIRAARKDAVEILSTSEAELDGPWGASENLREEIEEAARAGINRVDAAPDTGPNTGGAPKNVKPVGKFGEDIGLSIGNVRDLTDEQLLAFLDDTDRLDEGAGSAKEEARIAKVRDRLHEEYVNRGKPGSQEQPPNTMEGYTAKKVSDLQVGDRIFMGSGDETVTELTTEPDGRIRVATDKNPRGLASVAAGDVMVRDAAPEGDDLTTISDEDLAARAMEAITAGDDDTAAAIIAERRRRREATAAGGGAAPTGGTATPDAIDYNSILTPEVDRRLREAVRAAKAEGNDSTVIDSDAIVAAWGDKLTPAQYRGLDPDKADEVLFARLREIEAEEGLGATPAGGVDELTTISDEELNSRLTAARGVLRARPANPTAAQRAIADLEAEQARRKGGDRLPEGTRVTAKQPGSDLSTEGTIVGYDERGMARVEWTDPATGKTHVGTFNPSNVTERGDAPEATELDPTDPAAVKAAIEALPIRGELTVGGYTIHAWQGQGTSRLYRVRKADGRTLNGPELAGPEGGFTHTGAQSVSEMVAYENSPDGILAAQLLAIYDRGMAEGMDEAEVEDLVEDARRDAAYVDGAESVTITGARIREGDVLIAPDGTRQTVGSVGWNDENNTLEVTFTDDNPSDPPVPFGEEDPVEVAHGSSPTLPGSVVKPETPADRYRPLIAQRVVVTTNRGGRGVPPFTGTLEAVNDDGSIEVRGDNTGAVLRLPAERVNDVQPAPDAPELPPTSPHPVGARVKVKHTLIPDTGGIFPNSVSDGTVISARPTDNGLWDITVMVDNGQMESIQVSGRERNPSITPSNEPRPEFTPLADGTKVTMGNQSGTLEGYDPETGMARVKMDGSANGQVALYQPHMVKPATPPPAPPRRPRTPRTAATRAGGTGDGALAQAEIPTVEEIMADQGLDEAAAKKEWQRLYHNARFRIRRERLRKEAAAAKVTHLDPVDKPAVAGKAAIRTERSRSANAILGGIEGANADGSLEDAVDSLHDLVGSFRDAEPDGALADAVIPEAGPLVASFAANPAAASKARFFAAGIRSGSGSFTPEEKARATAYADALDKLADGDVEGLRPFLDEIQRGTTQRAFDDVAQGLMDTRLGDGDNPSEAIARVVDDVATERMDQGAVGALSQLLGDLSNGTLPKMRSGYDGTAPLRLPPRKVTPPDPDAGFEAKIEALRSGLPGGSLMFGARDPSTGRTMRLTAPDGGPTTESLERLDTVKAVGAVIDAEADALYKKFMAEAKLPDPDELEEREGELRTERALLMAELRGKSRSLGAAGQRSLRLQGKVEHIEKTWGKENGYEPTPPNMRGRSVSRAYGAFVQEMNAVRLSDPDKYQKLKLIDVAGEAAGHVRVSEALDGYNEKVRRTQAISKEIAAFKMGPATMRSKAYRETLARIRPVGPNGDSQLRLVGGAASATKALRWSEGFYPTDWLTHAGSVPLKVKRTTKRGHYETYSSSIALSKTTAPTVEGDKDALYGTAIHELGHHMEKMVPGLAAAEWVFLWQRTSKGTPDDGTRKRDPKKMIRMGEHGWDDEFKNHYSGRDYSGGAFSQPASENKSFELFTTGVQDLFAGDGDYLDDDFRRWLLGTMATI